MRLFIVLGHKATITPDFNLSDLPGSAGRLDLLCRSVTSSFCLSHDLRRDTELYLVLQDQVTLRFVGSRLRHLNPDERSTAALIQRALHFRSQLQGEVELESTPGIFISHRSLPQVLGEVKARVSQLFLLHEAGSPLRQAELKGDLGFRPEELVLMADLPRPSLGPKSLHADHCIVTVHNELDLRPDAGLCYNGVK